MTQSTRTRPALDLGPMTGTPEYVLARSQALVRTFAGLLDVGDIAIVDAPSGKTDCSSTIWLPLQDPEAYLVLEHELSHWLFETDVVMADRYVELIVEKMLRRAGIKLGANEALPYEKHLKTVVHSLWNVLEDWRVCWLWSQLYRGGGELLQQRWRDIVAYEYPPEELRENLLTCLAAYAAGTDAPNVPKAFEDAKRAMRRALNLVEGVDAVACLAITALLVEDIVDALLADNPPPPPSRPQAGGGGGSSNQSMARQAQQQQQQQKEAEAKARGQQVLKLLGGMVPRTGRFAQREGGRPGLGEADLERRPERKGLSADRGQGKLAAIQRLERAESNEPDESGMTPRQLIMSQGADAMEARLEEARRAMMRNQDTPDEANTVVCLGWSKECGIPIVRVRPGRDLPPPTATAYENRRILEQLRMKKRRKADYEGELNVDALLSALGAGELDRPFHIKTVRVPRFELLFVFDVSGSMTIGQALALTERALADSVFAVQAIRSKASMWGFSDRLYMFDGLGSPLHGTDPRISYGSTCTVQALDVAHKWGKRSPTTRAIMLVTDGWPTSCRARNSTGNPLDDLHVVLNEIREDKVPLTVLGIRHASCSVEDTKAQYDRAFGAGGYGMVADFDEMAKELPKAVRIMAEAHVTKGARRT